ncbi:MAG: hypothetical protein N838_33625 [Thiohalocapsa sp. PB-PSB1]|jgi:hypothetical protein|nr:MAG: hypothetical protein N838_33625 [Thiohalocapsa sp. PB-PSB1]
MGEQDRRTEADQTVDIGREAEALGDVSNADLARLDEEQGLLHKWRRERAVLILSIILIGSIGFSCLFLVIFSKNEETLDWARQTLTAIFGISAGAIFVTSTKQQRS